VNFTKKFVLEFPTKRWSTREWISWQTDAKWNAADISYT